MISSKIKTLSWILPVTALVVLSLSGILSCNRSIEPETHKIGGLFALTGVGADFGTTELNAVQMAIQEANDRGGIQGKNIELIVEDAPAENVNESVTAFKKLVDVDKVSIVIGPTWDDVGAAIAPLADQNQLVVFAPDASSGLEAKQDFPFFFSGYPLEDSEMASLASYLKSKGVRTVATVYNQDPFSEQFRSTFVREAKRAGLEVVSEFAISDPDAKDFRTQITRLKGSPPDAVYVEFTSQDTKGPFMRQAKELGLETIFVSSGSSETQSLLDSYGTFVEGLTYAFPRSTQRQKEFFERYQAVYGEIPRAITAPHAYDSMNMLIKVLRDGARSGEEIRRALLAIEDYPGVSSEHISFDEKGRVQWPPEGYVIKTVKDGKFVEVK